MAQITILKDAEGKRLYPVTTTGAVFDDKGRDLETRFQMTSEEIERAKLQLLVDRATAAGIVYNENTGFFELNGLTDLTAVEVEKILHYSVRFSSAATDLYSHKYPRVRTLLPTELFGNNESVKSMYMYCSHLETIRFHSGYGDIVRCTNVNNLFHSCYNLREVYGVISVEQCAAASVMTGVCKKCNRLEGIYILGLKYSFSMEDCPLWRLDCVEYIVANAINTTAITITVHPDVYAKLTGDTTNEAAAALSAEELEAWGAVLTAAVEKNIAFATV